MSAQFAVEKRAGQLSLTEVAIPACRFCRARTNFAHEIIFNFPVCARIFICSDSFFPGCANKQTAHRANATC
jgi:alpha-D-ribose 1-methylphosphonate 5-phosphate C-P lyase